MSVDRAQVRDAMLVIKQLRKWEKPAYPERVTPWARGLWVPFFGRHTLTWNGCGKPEPRRLVCQDCLRLQLAVRRASQMSCELSVFVPSKGHEVVCELYY